MVHQIRNSLKYVASKDQKAALDKVFNINVFLINQNGKIHWANDHMLKSICIPELYQIQGKHVSIFGDKPWINTKKVIKQERLRFLGKSLKIQNT